MGARGAVVPREFNSFRHEATNTDFVLPVHRSNQRVAPHHLAMFRVQLDAKGLMPMHSFLRVDLTGDDLQLALMNIEWLQKHLEQHPDAIAVTDVDNRHILSAPTPTLRDFIAAHAAKPEFFMDPIELKRTE